MMHYLKFTFVTTAILLVVASTIAAAEPADTNYDEKKVPPYELPKLLIDKAGQSVGRSEWDSHRRAEILHLFEESVYGKTPKRQLSVRYEVIDSDANAFNGRATRQQIAAFFGEKQYRIDILLYIPNKTKGPVPAFLGMNFYGNHTIHSDPKIIQRGKKKARGSFSKRWQAELIIDHGYALATIHRDQVDPDNYRNGFTDGIHPLFYANGQKKPKPDEWGSIGAWAWSLSRVLDYLETNKQVNASHVAVIGHSRLGKTALWAGAQDPRFAMVISNNSGCGGAALYRRCYGERIHHMFKPLGYWFCTNHRQYQKKEHELPVDQHMLLALIAPRPLYVASATADRWADPKGEFLAAKHASPVYDLFDTSSLSGHEMPKPDQPIHSTIGYHLRTGKHDMTAYDWRQYIKFANRFLKQE
ncbi:Multidomain esterase [Pontiella desulfatans]|uniref:Multidomain esterase n=1 Tax=Pontiella desulfatans TaxID=2750659 RepID=A0A6C2U1F6_PONDE|nr:esterase family protein [Pontiella desulfatans]VGO13421.1 Multidomain esterase [Pontiella desulfatans]